MVTISTIDYLVVVGCMFFAGVIVGCCTMADKFHLWPTDNEVDEEE